MSVKTERTKIHVLLSDSGASSESLSGHEYHFVVRGGSTGNATFGKPSASGDLVDGILMPKADDTTLASGTSVEVCTKGVYEIEAGATFNAGVSIMADAQGRGILATSGKWAKGRSREASGGAGHLVSIELLDGFYVP